MPPAIPAGPAIFAIPDNLPDLEAALLAPLNAAAPELKNAPTWPEGTESAHPFVGGETAAHDRIRHLVTAGAMSRYKDTRNGLLGTDFSTKLSAWLALGCITARQVHRYLLDFEDGKTPLGADGAGKAGHGRGENKGTASVRFELLWRDYMRLCTRKFGHRLFRAEGFRNEQGVRWKYPEDNAATASAIQRFLCGRTGTGLIDASQRELFLTGYTSNRARQNVASFLAKHMGVDWRIGAEWYEYLLADYDVSSNWGNWQYVAGVGNDPRMSTPSTGPDQSAGRVFNPVKQAFDYDSGGAYVRAWIPELRSLGYDAESLNTVFQAWKLSPARKQEMQLDGVDWVDRPLVRIPYSSNRRAGGGGGGGGGDGSGSSNRGRGGRNNHRRGGKNSKWSENADRSIR